ncbi:heme ABC transporter ATP-binding protein [Iodobacter sp. LRB]|uniref:heme ABC transporter ATP-binding protein n=1 Tax=unclassified Iodobacter TaxID=235634 RepID=UPI000C0D098C|nr:heme ABC transporter ATP-binding protein [Iodobacter sp. BJB302]PHV01866.1 heme ABC transporter ATP-binding protein [Iodobacter sp. BJB302]
MPSLLNTQNLYFKRGKQLILNDVSLTLQAGEVTAILGANGAGKSTLLSLLSGEIKADQGEICLKGVNIADMPAAKLARQRAVLPQNPNLTFDLGVEEVIAMGAYPFAELSPHTVCNLSLKVLQLADISHLARRRYYQLSGGEQQRVQFARVLLQILANPGQPRYLLLDEPTASLDPRHQHDLLAVVSRLAQSENIAVAVVLHDVNLAARWCNHLLLLKNGSTVACGTPKEVLTPSLLSTAYGIASTVIPHPKHEERCLVLFE